MLHSSLSPVRSLESSQSLVPRLFARTFENPHLSRTLCACYAGVQHTCFENLACSWIFKYSCFCCDILSRSFTFDSHAQTSRRNFIFQFLSSGPVRKNTVLNVQLKRQTTQTVLFILHMHWGQSLWEKKQFVTCVILVLSWYSIYRVQFESWSRDCVFAVLFMSCYDQAKFDHIFMSVPYQRGWLCNTSETKVSKYRIGKKYLPMPSLNWKTFGWNLERYKRRVKPWKSRYENRSVKKTTSTFIVRTGLFPFLIWFLHDVQHVSARASDEEQSSPCLSIFKYYY